MIPPAIPDWYEPLFNRYKAFLNSKSALYIALSAGIDSNILLHWLFTYKAELPPITAIHVNHNLHGKDSYIWANFAKERAEFYDFPFINYDIELDLNDPKGIESAGRNARYIKFAQTMERDKIDPHKDGLLLVAHHQSDQAETLFFRLIRGAGVRGLGAMRVLSTVSFADYSGTYTIDLFRPLLTVSKQALYKVGETLNLPWMEDYTNHETDFTRNQIRNAIFPEVEQYFPYYEESFAKSAHFLQEAHDLLIEIADSDLNVLLENDHQLNREKLLKLTPLRQKNALRTWLNRLHLSLNAELFNELYRTFIEQTPSHHTKIALKSYTLRFFQNHLYLVKNHTNIKPQLIWVDANNAPPQSFWQSKNLSLKKREQGAYFHPLYRDKRQTLKKLLQEANIPTWMRDNLWMLVDKETSEILWVEHLGIAQSLNDECVVKGALPAIRFESI